MCWGGRGLDMDIAFGWNTSRVCVLEYMRALRVATSGEDCRTPPATVMSARLLAAMVNISIQLCRWSWHNILLVMVQNFTGGPSKFYRWLKFLVNGSNFYWWWLKILRDGLNFIWCWFKFLLVMIQNFTGYGSDSGDGSIFYRSWQKFLLVIAQNFYLWWLKFTDCSVLCLFCYICWCDALWVTRGLPDLFKAILKDLQAQKGVKLSVHDKTGKKICTENKKQCECS